MQDLLIVNVSHVGEDIELKEYLKLKQLMTTNVHLVANTGLKQDNDRV